MSATQIAADQNTELEARIGEAKQQGRLIDDAILLFRKIVDRMPTTTWLREAKRLDELEGAEGYEARRQAEAREELDDLRRELQVLTVEWLGGWYERGGVYIGRQGSLEELRHLVEISADTAQASSGAAGDALSPQALKARLDTCAPTVAVELMQCAHLVVSDAMKYALSG